MIHFLVALAAALLLVGVIGLCVAVEIHRRAARHLSSAAQSLERASASTAQAAASSARAATGTAQVAKVLAASTGHATDNT